MRLNNDLREFLELLNSRGVDYVIVGAHSLAFHGRPRYTGDLDILVRATPENAAKLVGLLNQFGFADCEALFPIVCTLFAVFVLGKINTVQGRAD